MSFLSTTASPTGDQDRSSNQETERSHSSYGTITACLAPATGIVCYGLKKALVEFTPYYGTSQGAVVGDVFGRSVANVFMDSAWWASLLKIAAGVIFALLCAATMFVTWKQFYMPYIREHTGIGGGNENNERMQLVIGAPGSRQSESSVSRPWIINKYSLSLTVLEVLQTVSPATAVINWFMRAVGMQDEFSLLGWKGLLGVVAYYFIFVFPFALVPIHQANPDINYGAVSKFLLQYWFKICGANLAMLGHTFGHAVGALAFIPPTWINNLGSVEKAIFWLATTAAVLLTMYLLSFAVNSFDKRILQEHCDTVCGKDSTRKLTISPREACGRKAAIYGLTSPLHVVEKALPWHTFFQSYGYPAHHWLALGVQSVNVPLAWLYDYYSECSEAVNDIDVAVERWHGEQGAINGDTEDAIDEEARCGLLRIFGR
ncbi:MAG: hypothetical protein CMF50_05070 [Legionellales bacterium]|nr:hypothetical protein [Legionellales bacterium]|tara:strand:+ start:62863 stop:64155 length:1293 start_codon:yes stop_codon:yes gene_type:complete